MPVRKREPEGPRRVVRRFDLIHQKVAQEHHFGRNNKDRKPHSDTILSLMSGYGYCFSVADLIVSYQEIQKAAEELFGKTVELQVETRCVQDYDGYGLSTEWTVTSMETDEEYGKRLGTQAERALAAKKRRKEEAVYEKEKRRKMYEVLKKEFEK